MQGDTGQHRAAEKPNFEVNLGFEVRNAVLKPHTNDHFRFELVSSLMKGASCPGS